MPFAFIFLIASSNVTQANQLQVLLAATLRASGQPGSGRPARDFVMIIAFINSFILTVVSVAALVIFGAMVAYVWQRRREPAQPVGQPSWCWPA